MFCIDLNREDFTKYSLGYICLLHSRIRSLTNFSRAHFTITKKGITVTNQCTAHLSKLKIYTNPDFYFT